MHWCHEESLDAMFVHISKLHRMRAHTLFGALGLSRGQPPVLFALWQQDGLTQKELSEKLLIKPATMSVVLQTMEKSGFICRRPDDEDHRVSRVYLTEAGRQLKDDVEKVMKTMEEEFFANFTLEEKLLLRRFFMQMKDNLVRANNLAD